MQDATRTRSGKADMAVILYIYAAIAVAFLIAGELETSRIEARRPVGWDLTDRFLVHLAVVVASALWVLALPVYLHAGLRRLHLRRTLGETQARIAQRFRHRGVHAHG